MKINPVEQSAVGAARGPSEIAQRFKELYGGECRVFRAPGRINLIGEHTDYNDGFVMPAAIDLSCWAAVSLTSNRAIEVHSGNFNQSHTFHLDCAQPLGGWIDYVQGVALMLEKFGYRLPGAKLLIWSDVPMGSGLASSAALEVAVALALLDTQPAPCDRSQLALVCQRAENEFVGARCGIMDQFVSSHGRAAHALMLDCRSLQHRYLPVPTGTCLVICNSLVKHEIAGGEYNQRRYECEEGVRLLSRSFPGLKALRDLSPADLECSRERLPASVYKRCRHVVGENERVLAAATALQEHDLKRLKDLMAASHKSLRDDFEVSCPELDLLVDVASQIEGVHGARMTGGGFGGCTVNVVSAEAVEGFAKKITSAYQEQIGVAPKVYVSEASSGAERVEILA